MKVFVAGGTGAVGRQLVPQLLAAGHEVVASTRSESKAAQLWDLGAEPVVLDALDREAVLAAVAKARPDAVVNELTALARPFDPKHFDDVFAETNELRTRGTANLLAAAPDARHVAQSYAGWPYAREGGPVKTEDDPLDPEPPAAMRRTLAAIRELETMVLAADGIVLRYGALYGPGTSDDQAALLRQRKFPVVGRGSGVWSFVRGDDAAAATVLAVERGAPGIYNVVDDEPAPVAEWLPRLADAIGAKPPRHVPAWLARPAVGEAGIALMTEVRGASNAKAKRELGWTPRHPSWREGFAA
jgi:nucleoside-diphosphate-sugar epimerase